MLKIYQKDAIEIDDMTITLDLNGKDLIISNPSGYGLEVKNRSNLNIIGTGNFIINTHYSALRVNFSTFNSDDSVNVILKW